MFNIKEDQIPLLKEKEFSVLFFYANGCFHCESVKPSFEDFSIKYPNIQFLSMEFSDGRPYYEKFAEDTQAVVYEPILENGQPKLDDKGIQIANAVPQINADGNPIMVKSYLFPSFYVHHTKAATEENPYGFVGGFDGNNLNEARGVLEAINQILVQKGS